MSVVTVRTTHPITGAEVEIEVHDYKDGQGSAFRWIVWGGWAQSDAWRHDAIRSTDRAKAQEHAKAEAKASGWSDWRITAVLD